MDGTQSNADDRRGHDDGSLAVLAITAFRPEEVTATTSGMGAETTVVTLDDTGPARYLAAVVRTRNAIRRHDPDVLLLDCNEVPGLLVALVAARYGVPIVPRFVGDVWRERLEEGLILAGKRGQYRRLGRYVLGTLLNTIIFALATGYVVVSTELEARVRERTGCAPEHIAVVPVPTTTPVADPKDTVDADTDVRAALGIEQDRIVLTVTNLKYHAKFEGVAAIVEEIVPILRRNPDLAYVIAGDGYYHDDLLEFLDAAIEDEDLRRRIYAPGFVEDVSRLHAAADAFAYVSYLDGYPNAVLEAQAAGLPVVVNPAYGMLDQVEDGESGLFADPQTPGAIGDRVSKLLEDPALRRRLGTGASARVERENTPSATGRRLESFLERLLATIDGGRDTPHEPRTDRDPEADFRRAERVIR